MYFPFLLLVLIAAAVNSATFDSHSDGLFVDSEMRNGLQVSDTTYDDANIQHEILKKLNFLTEKVQNLEENLNSKLQVGQLSNETLEDKPVEKNILPNQTNITTINEISSLVRWLVRKSFSTEQHQNNLFGGLLHMLKLQQVKFVAEVKESFESGTNLIIEKSEEMEEKFSQLLNRNTEIIENATNKISSSKYGDTKKDERTVSYSQDMNDGESVRDNFLNTNSLDVINRVLNNINSSSSEYGPNQQVFNNMADSSGSSESDDQERNKAKYLLSSPASVLTVFTVPNEEFLNTSSPSTEDVNSSYDDKETTETNEVFKPNEFRSHYDNNNSNKRKDPRVGLTEDEENKSELGLLLGKWKREFSIMLNARESNSDGKVEREVSSQLQEIQDSILGLKFYFDSGILKLRHQLEDIIVTSESSLFSTISDTLSDSLSTSIKRKMVSSFAEIVDSAVQEGQDIALKVADAAVMSVSSAAVASSQHTTEKLTSVIKMRTAEINNALSEKNGCPVQYHKVGEMCLSLPTVARKSEPSNASSIISWPDANDLCQENTGELLSVRSYRELFHLQKSLRRITLGRFWLGGGVSLLNFSSDAVVDAKHLMSNYEVEASNDIENSTDDGDERSDSLQNSKRWALFKDHEKFSIQQVDAEELLIPICQHFHSFFET